MDCALCDRGVKSGELLFSAVTLAGIGTKLENVFFHLECMIGLIAASTVQASSAMQEDDDDDEEEEEEEDDSPGLAHAIGLAVARHYKRRR